MWTVLEKTDRDLGNISLTFGVGGRTGTVGGKQVILDEGNRSRSEEITMKDQSNRTHIK